jgi:hypothetical protein
MTHHMGRNFKSKVTHHKGRNFKSKVTHHKGRNFKSKVTHHKGRNFKSKHFRNSEMLYSKSIWFYHIWGCCIDYASFQSNKILKTLKKPTTLCTSISTFVSEDLYMSFSTDLLIDQKWHLLSFIQSNLY